jgi:hypothetical protein
MPEYRRFHIEGGTYFFTTVVTYRCLPTLITSPKFKPLYNFGFCYYAGGTRIAMRTGVGTGTTGLQWLFGDHPSLCSGQALGSSSRIANADGTSYSETEDWPPKQCIVQARSCLQQLRPSSTLGRA